MLWRSNIASWAVGLAFAGAFGALFQPDAALLPLHAALAAAGAVPPAAAARVTVALGSNVCIDAIVPARAVFGGRTGAAGGAAGGAASEPAPPAAADHARLRSLADAEAAFRFWFAAGAAAERSADAPVLAALVGRAEAGAPGAAALRRSLGGNAALMAAALAASGARVVLGGPVGPAARALLPPAVALAAPAAGADEVHLILEFSRDEALLGASAPRANRFIVTADAANAAGVDAMIATIRAADAGGGEQRAEAGQPPPSASATTALVVAGLHMLEPLPPAERSAALAALAGALAQRTGSYAVHIEIASSADAAWSAAVASALFPLVDSVGFNEQEAAFLFAAVGGEWSDDAAPRARGPGPATVAGTRADVAGAAPRAVAVAGVLRVLFEEFPALSRLHFHALAMHVVGHRAGGWAGWARGARAVAAGSATATTAACRLDATALAAAGEDAVFSVSAVRFATADPRGAAGGGGGGGGGAGGVRRVRPAAPVVEWEWPSTAGTLAFSLAPVVACRRPASTVGLGDAVSAAGLLADVAPRE